MVSLNTMMMMMGMMMMKIMIMDHDVIVVMIIMMVEVMIIMMSGDNSDGAGDNDIDDIYVAIMCRFIHPISFHIPSIHPSIHVFAHPSLIL